MKRTRWAALLLALALFAAPSAAAEEWLIPKAREYGAFTDTAGTLCETAARTCCEAGLMDGVDQRHFMPSAGLSHAQIVVIAARLHKLLTGGTLAYFEPISLTGEQWWTPYDGYLRQEIPALETDERYALMTGDPTRICSRQDFLLLLAAVLDGAGVLLPEINAVDAVPDCQDPAIIRFYRWGILGGKDEYGTLFGGASLSREAGSAMLARLIDPAQRLTLKLKPLELCRELLDVDPEAELLVIAGQPITAEEFMPELVRKTSYYNHAHFGSMMLEMSGRTPLDEALDNVCGLVLCETLAAELSVPPVPPADDSGYFNGYHGLTAHGQAWDDYHTELVHAVHQALGEEAFPTDRIPRPEFTEQWHTLNFSDVGWRLYDIPYWGGHF